ncbi:MAG: amidohydrolase family protein [Candidatus Marinimicrobia bacterium]|nr:amidohydrolase family protein [Candidatus Neomarinimicrobiota bacterium]
MFILIVSGCLPNPTLSPEITVTGDPGVEGLLLKDYRPVSIYKIPHTEIAKAKYPVIDMHSHAYALSEGGIDQAVAHMDAVGIQKTIILTKAHGAEFDSIYAAYAPYGDRFEIWCGFDYTGFDSPGYGPAAAAELERCYKVGARGVGELGDKGRGLTYCDPPAVGMHLDDPRMDPVLEKCAELGMPINIHVAEPKWMYEAMDETNDGLMNAFSWRLDNQENIVGHQGMIDILENAVKRHPETTFIACHYANLSYDLAQLGSLLSAYPNLYVDNAARYAEVGSIPRTVAAFYIKFQDRIFYGTDMGHGLDMYRMTLRQLETADEHFYGHEQYGYHWALNGMDLPDEVLKKIYYENAQRLFGSKE